MHTFTDTALGKYLFRTDESSLRLERMQTLTRPHPDSEFLILPGLNHLMQHSKTGKIEEYGQLEETMAPEVLEAIARFIKKITTKSF